MLAIILTIFKIIGIILLSIIGLLLLILFLVLFIPVKYKAVGKYIDKKANMLFNISYLFHIVSISFFIKNNKPIFYIRLFGIKLKHKNKNKKNLDSKSSKDKDSKEEQNEEESKEDNCNDNDSKPQKEKKTNNISFYIELLGSEYFKNAFDVCKTRIGKILKSILPQKGKISIWLGLEDAGLTGEIVGYYYALYAFIGHAIRLNPVYDKKCTDIDFKIKGRIYGFIIIFHLLSILLNKNILKVLKAIKKHKV